MAICLALAVSCVFLVPPQPVGAVSQAAAASPAAPPRLPQILAFDLPAGVDWGPGPGKIRGFLLGYFQGTSLEPLWVLDVARELTRLEKDGTVKLMLPLSDLPPGVYSARIRIRTASVDSDWSPPSPPFLVPELRKRGRSDSGRGGSRAARPPRPLNLEPSVADAVRPLLPKDADLAEAALGFQKPVQFVSALLAARSLGIPFPDLKAKLFEPSGRIRSLQAALADLRPDRDVTAETRKALEQARRLVANARRSKKEAPESDSGGTGLAQCEVQPVWNLWEHLTGGRA